VSSLEADLYAIDVDVCVISETHLKREIPDSIVTISNYTIYRRDRNWFGNDKRQKGGIAVYIRNDSINILKVYRAEFFECISIIAELPSKHKVLIVGVYKTEI
jgi:hypothetical protein